MVLPPTTVAVRVVRATCDPGLEPRPVTGADEGQIPVWVVGGHPANVRAERQNGQTPTPNVGELVRDQLSSR